MMRVQAEVFERLIRHILPLNAESLVFLDVFYPYKSLYSNLDIQHTDPNPRVKRWAGHARYTKMQSQDKVFKRRLDRKYRSAKYTQESYGCTYLSITNIKWITPQDVEVEAMVLGKDWSENDYSSAEFYRYKLHKRDNRWRATSEKITGVAG